MNSVILRRRKLGRGSTNGIVTAMSESVRVIRNFRQDDANLLAGQDSIPVLFRWGCTSSIRELLLPAATVTVNDAESIQWCNNKKISRLEMQAAGVPVPETWCASRFRDMAERDNDYVNDSFVMRPATHAQGRNLIAGTMEQIIGSYDESPIYHSGYVSLLIDKVAEFRVFVAQNRVVWVAQKTPGNPDQVAWNVAQGGRFDNVRWGDWPKRVIQASLAAAKVSGTDFCGVDVMVDADGNPYVLEVNSAPSQTSPYRQQCVAKVFDHIIRNGKQHFDDVPDSPRRTWKSYIHPALRGSSDG